MSRSAGSGRFPMQSGKILAVFALLVVSALVGGLVPNEKVHSLGPASSYPGRQIGFAGSYRASRHVATFNIQGGPSHQRL